MRFTKAMLNLLLIVILCTACTTQLSDGNTPDTSKSEGNTEPGASPVIAAFPTPNWARATQEGARVIDGVDLDGIGGHDDVVHISGYRWRLALPHPQAIAVCARLGTGEVFAKVIQIEAQIQNVMLADNLVTGHEAIVLELENPTSNYGAADVYVFSVGTSDYDQPYLWECFHEKVKQLIPEIELLQIGTEVVDLDGGRTGLCLKIVDGALDPPKEKTVYWDSVQKNWALYENHQTAK